MFSESRNIQIFWDNNIQNEGVRPFQCFTEEETLSGRGSKEYVLRKRGLNLTIAFEYSPNRSQSRTSAKAVLECLGMLLRMRGMTP